MAATPAVVEELVRHGHEVLIEAGAGLGSGIADEEYARGRRIVGSPRMFTRRGTVVKVKEPLPHEIEMLRRPGAFVLAPARPQLTQGLLDRASSASPTKRCNPTGQLPP